MGAPAEGRVAMAQTPPSTLPADFFAAGSEPPKKLPRDFDFGNASSLAVAPPQTTPIAPIAQPPTCTAPGTTFSLGPTQIGPLPTPGILGRAREALFGGVRTGDTLLGQAAGVLTGEKPLMSVQSAPLIRPEAA